jgi:type IV secretory pathway VirB4 component
MSLRLTPHIITTKTAACLNPFMVNTKDPQPGLLLGQNLHGGLYKFDPFKLYLANQITSPNAVIIGQIGRGKSAIIKTLILRMKPNSYQVLIVDPKGEYSSLQAAMDATVIALKPNGRHQINPLGQASLWQDVSHRNTVYDLVHAILQTCLKRELTPIERSIVQTILRLLDDYHNLSTKEPTLKDLINFLFSPSDEVLSLLKLSAHQFKECSRELCYELRRLIDGDLKGMFDATTVNKVDLMKNVIIIDLSNIYSSEYLGLVMACVSTWMQSILSSSLIYKKTFIFYDEAWALLTSPSIVSFLKTSFKLARAKGISNFAVIHRISDLLNENNQITLGLLKDSEIKILLRQDPGEIEPLIKYLGLNEAEAQILPMLPKGVALIKLPNHTDLVGIKLTELEQQICDSDKYMRLSEN